VLPLEFAQRDPGASRSCASRNDERGASPSDLVKYIDAVNGFPLAEGSIAVLDAADGGAGWCGRPTAHAWRPPGARRAKCTYDESLAPRGPTGIGGCIYTDSARQTAYWNAGTNQVPHQARAGDTLR
jgi:hypothetical protein